MSNTVTKDVKPYHLALTVGMAEPMHMKGTKGKGETMISGPQPRRAMAAGTMGGMAIEDKQPACNHHVELKVVNAATKKIVTNAHVSITMVNTTKHLTVRVPIMTMMGSEGMKDLHYGNNVFAPAGWYDITVTVNGKSFTAHRMPILTHR
jgi:hypothetical protein